MYIYISDIAKDWSDIVNVNTKIGRSLGYVVSQYNRLACSSRF